MYYLISMQFNANAIVHRIPDMRLRSQFETKEYCWMYGMNNIPSDVYDPVLFDDQTFWL